MAASCHAPTLGTYRSPPLGPIRDRNCAFHSLKASCYVLVSGACGSPPLGPIRTQPHLRFPPAHGGLLPLACSCHPPPPPNGPPTTSPSRTYCLPLPPAIAHYHAPHLPYRRPAVFNPSALHHPLYLLPPNAPATSLTARHSSKLQAQFCRHCGRMPTFEYGRVGGVG
jgi:hypothetical protein